MLFLCFYVLPLYLYISVYLFCMKNRRHISGKETSQLVFVNVGAINRDYWTALRKKRLVLGAVEEREIIDSWSINWDGMIASCEGEFEKFTSLGIEAICPIILLGFRDFINRKVGAK